METMEKWFLKGDIFAIRGVCCKSKFFNFFDSDKISNN